MQMNQTRQLRGVRLKNFETK